MSIQFNPDSAAVAGRERIAFIQAAWHSDIVNESRDAFLKEFATLSDKQVDLFEVPGVFEIPLHAKSLACSGQYAAVVAAGLIVDGGIYRHEFVSQAVIEGLMQVQLDTGTPVFSAVLTPHHFHESGEHHAFFKQHFVLKGGEAARACAQTLESLRALNG